MKKLLVLLLSLMLVTSMFALGEELSNPVDNPIGSPTNNIVVPVEPQEPQNGEPKVGEPINQPVPPEGMEQPKFQPQPGQPQDNFNKNQPKMENQPGKYNQPPNPPQGKPFIGKDGQNQQKMLPPLDENEEQKEAPQDGEEQPQEIPEGNGAWVPLKKIGNFFYFWKPKDAPKEQSGDQQNMGNTKNNFKKLPPLEKSPQEAFKEDQRAPTEEEQNNDKKDKSFSQNPDEYLLKKDVGDYQYVGDQEGTDENDFQAIYEKDKANTLVKINTFKGPGEADTAFEQDFKERNMEIVLVKNMKLVKHTLETDYGKVDEYLWPAHDKIISLSVPEGESLDENLLAFEYLSKYPSKLNPKSDTLGLPNEGMNSLQATPQFKEGELPEGQQSGSSIPTNSGAMQAGTGTDGKNNFTPQAPPGCKISENKGVPTGFRLINEGSSQYCDMDDQLHPQKELDASCQNNFECQSNQCSSGKCLDLNAKMEETQGLLQKILAWLGAKE